MKKIFLSLIAVMATMSINAQQVVKVYENGFSANYTNTSTQKIKVILEAAPAHEYVDLDLPSGTLWATCNVGAVKPEDPGFHYAWGETKGYTVYDRHIFDINNYKFFDYDEYKYTKYCTSSYEASTVDDKTELEPVDDAATADWGSDWCMPTIEQYEELIDNCTNSWDDVNKCVKLSSKSDESKFILLPAAGCSESNYVQGFYTNGNYWSRSLTKLSYSNNYTYILVFNRYPNGNSYNFYMNISNASGRNQGCSVRPVRVQK